MTDIIQLLPDSIANQIAAGDVIQRPASVVKELMENAIDADSTTIKLIIKDAGKSLIQVTDNGKGMSPADARMCFEKHATSKIRKSEDLFHIKSMGSIINYFKVVFFGYGFNKFNITWISINVRSEDC